MFLLDGSTFLTNSHSNFKKLLFRWKPQPEVYRLLVVCGKFDLLLSFFHRQSRIIHVFFIIYPPWYTEETQSSESWTTVAENKAGDPSSAIQRKMSWSRKPSHDIREDLLLRQDSGMWEQSKMSVQNHLEFDVT